MCYVQDMNTALVKNAIDAAGAAKIAKSLGVTAGAVSHWRLGRRKVPLLRAVQIERLTEGAVSRSSLRPDIDWSAFK